MFSRYRQNVTAVSAIGTVTFLTCAYIFIIIIVMMICLVRARALSVRPTADAGPCAICSGEPENDVSRATGGKSHFEKRKIIIVVLPTPTGSRAAQESQKPTVNRVIISGFFSRLFCLPVLLRLDRFAPFNTTTMRIDAPLSRIYYAGPVVIELTETENAFKT